MIKIHRHDNGVSVNGHANYAEPGRDIVCAAVSTLTQNLIVSLEALTKDEIQYDMQPGAVVIRHGNLSDGGKLLVDSFFVGVQMVSRGYPDYVQVVSCSEFPSG